MVSEVEPQFKMKKLFSFKIFAIVEVVLAGIYVFFQRFSLRSPPSLQRTAGKFNRRDAENAKCFLESTLVFRSIPKRLRVLCVSAVNSPFGCGYAALCNRVVPSCFFDKFFPEPRSGERI